MKIEDVFNLFKRDIIEFIPHSVANWIQENKGLRIKFGADPSAPELHLGHMVVLNKLRLLQEMGHTVVFLIGDFTAMIGDPTGKSETRPVLSLTQVAANSQTYQDQVFKILRKDRTEVVFNSEWLGKLNSLEMIQLSAKYTVARMLERDDFHKRFHSQQSISVHEFMYPLLQGYDSVVLKNDLEIGGSDQKFNVLMGRHLQKEYGFKRLQGVLLTPLLEGLDGVHKMSKSLKNHIGLTDSPKEMFGKIMSIQDNKILSYFSLLTWVSDTDLANYKHRLENGENPRLLKSLLAKTIVGYLHTADEAFQAEVEFNRIFSQKGLPDTISDLFFSLVPTCLSDLAVSHHIVSSKKEFQRLVAQGAVYLQDQRVSDPFFLIQETHDQCILKVGKRQFFKLCRRH